MALADTSNPVLVCEMKAWDRQTSSVVTIYLVDARQEGFRTTGSDTPAHQQFDALLVEGYRVQASLVSGNRLFGGQEGEPERQVGLDGGGGARSFGGLTVRIPGPDDRPAWVDRLLTGRYDLTGRKLTFKLLGGPDLDDGSDQWAYSSAVVVHDLQVAEMAYSESKLTISVREDVEELRGTWDRATFSGTGGDEGEEDVKGQYKPYGIGYVQNVPLTFLGRNDEGWGRWVGHVSEAGGDVFDQVAYDGGVELTPLGDNDEWTDGILTKENDPTADLTADLRVSTGSGTAVSRRGALEILDSEWGVGTIEYRAGFPNDDGVSAWWGTESVTVSDALEQILSPLGYWYVARDGAVTVAWLQHPRDVDADMTLGFGDLTGPPDLIAIEPAHWSVWLRHSQSHMVQDDDALLGAVTDDHKRFVRQEWRGAVAQDRDLFTPHPRASQIEVESPIEEPDTSGDAAALPEAVELFNLAKWPWEFWRVRIGRPGKWMSVWVGDHVDLDWLKPSPGDATEDPLHFDRSGFALKEDGDYVLQENGDRVKLEPDTTRRFLVAGVVEDWASRRFELVLAAPRTGG